MDLQLPPLKVKLKGGKIVNIRVGVPDDAAEWVALIKAYLVNSDSIPMLPDEFEYDREAATAHIEKYQRPNHLLLVAEYEGTLVGNIDLTQHPRKRLSHTGRVGMGIAKGWRNQGLGFALLKTSLDWAKSQADLEMIWLDVYANNVKGVALYQKLGFIEVGTTPSLFKHGDEYFDSLKLYLKLENYSPSKYAFLLPVPD